MKRTRLALLAALCASPEAFADEPLVVLERRQLELELARVPDSDELCTAGAVVRFRLARAARVSLTTAQGPVSPGAVDGAPVRSLSELPLGAGVHELVFAPPRRRSLALGERPFTLLAREPGGAQDVAVAGGFREERIDRAVLPVGRTFLAGVDLLDGHLVRQVADLKLEGRHLELEITRTYTSAGRSPAGLAGAGWHFNYESALTDLAECGLALVRTADGSTVAFRSDEAGRFRPQRGYHTRLLRNPDGSFDFLDKASIRHHFEGRAAGRPATVRLAWIEEPHGDRIVLSYDEVGRLREVCERHPRLGPVRSLVLTHTIAGGFDRLASVSAWGLGLRVDYSYDKKGNLIAARRDDREEGSGIDRYEYADDPRDPHQMTSATNAGEAGSSYSYLPGGRGDTHACEALDAAECVREVKAADGTTRFAWDRSGARPGTLRVEVRVDNGAATRYLLNDDGSPLEIDEPSGVGRSWWRSVWNRAHLVKTSEHSSAGREISYEHDASGNLTLERDLPKPGARTSVVSYAYDPRFNKLVHKVDAQGRTSRWTLDPATGDLLREQAGDGKVTSWAYDRDGCLAEHIDAAGRRVFRRPDTFCNATEVQGPDGKLVRRRYDARGRLVDETGGASR